MKINKLFGIVFLIFALSITMVNAYQEISIRWDATGTGTGGQIGRNSGGAWYGMAQYFETAVSQDPVNNITVRFGTAQGSGLYRIDVGIDLDDLNASAICQSDDLTISSTGEQTFQFSTPCELNSSSTYWYHIVRAEYFNSSNVYVQAYYSGGTNYAGPGAGFDISRSEVASGDGDIYNWQYPFGTANTWDLSSKILSYSIPTGPFFSVTAKDSQTNASLSNIIITLDNGSVYTNSSSSIVYTPFNDSRNLNFTVSVDNYFNQTFTNYNTSTNLQANLTPYPTVFIYDAWTNESLNATVMINGNTYYTNNGSIQVPVNDSQTVLITDQFYFNTSFSHNFALSDLNTSLAQNDIKFNALELITNISISGGSFSINGDGVTNVVSENVSVYLKSGDYNVTFSKSGYYDKILSFTVGSTENKTINISDVSSSLVQIIAREFYLNTSILSFNVTINNTQYGYLATYSTITGAVNVSVIQGVEFTFNVSSNGYLSDTDAINSTVTLYNHTAYLFKNNKIIANFFYEYNLSEIHNVTYSLYSVNTQGYGIASGVSSGSNVNLDNIPSGFYGLQYSKNNFTTRNYFFNIPVETNLTTNISLYLLEEAYSTTFVSTVTDKSNQALTDVYVSLLRRYVIGNQTQYKVVEMFKPAFALGGTAPFTAEANEVAYLFRVQRDDGTVLFQGSGTTENNYASLYLIDQQIYLKVNTGATAFDSYKDIIGLETSLVNTSDTFWLSWADTENKISQICLQVKANNTQAYSNTCSNADSGILSAPVIYSNSTYYVARAIVQTTQGGESYPVNIAYIDNRVGATSVFGFLGIFILILTLITCAIVLAREPAISLIVMALAILMYGPTFLGFVEIGLILQGSILVSSLIMAFIVGGNE